VPDTPTGVAAFEERIKMLFDLQILAFRADITRISTLMLAHELNNATFPTTNIRDGFRNLSHHSNVRANMDKFAELNAYHSIFASFLEAESDSRRRRKSARPFPGPTAAA
jgi:hypothetical protein